MALRPKLNRIWTSTNSTLRRDPGDAKYLQGWISEIPTFQVLNYLQWKVDTTFLALAERGVFEWGSDVQYVRNSLAWDDTNSTIYVATVAAPDRTKPPSTNPAHWAASSIQITRAEYDSIKSSIQAHVADVTGNPHRLTAGRLNAYNKAEIDNILTLYRTLVSDHANDVNNPHKLTALVVGAVPITGGTYTGNVQFNALVYFDAAKTKQIRTSDGLYLQSGNFVVGLDSSGDAVAGSTTSKSKLVSENTFPTLKAANESSYATPAPTFSMPLVSDINILVGSSTTDSGSWNPTFSVDDGCLFASNSTTANTGFITDGEVVSTRNPITFVFDVMSKTNRIPADTAYSFLIGAETLRVILTGAGRIVAETAGAASVGYQLTGPINTWYRVAAVYDSGSVKLYLDGKLVASQSNVVATSNSGRARISIPSKAVANVRSWYCRNFRMWQAALTGKQISTL